MCCQSLAGNSYKSHVVCKEGAMTCVCVCGLMMPKNGRMVIYYREVHILEKSD